MNVGLIGYPQSGKSTLYRAAARGKAKGDVTAVPVPDPRFAAVVAQVGPKKATPATVVVRDDVDPIAPVGKAFSQRFLDAARNADLLLHVIRSFESDSAAFHAPQDPQRDFDAVEVEMVLADLQLVESRLERLERTAQAKSPGSDEYLERMLLERVRSPLESGEPLRALAFDDVETGIARGFQFLSIKPIVAAFNVGESEAAAPGEGVEAAIARLVGRGVPAFAVCAPLEEELARLEPADQPEFLASLGLCESASDRLVRAVYDAMGLITFFTAGENETKAWPLRDGSTALKAAATIHTDIAKGFIRAEVTHWSDYEAWGSVAAAASAGKMSLEGKEYVVLDGDVLNIRNKS